MRGLLKRVAESRFRISTRLYSWIGAAVVLTVAASFVGWYSINRVGDVQARVNEGSVPAMVVAFSVAQDSSELVAAAPRVASATTEDALDSVTQDINETYVDFDSGLVLLESTDMRPGQNQLVRGLGVTLRSNIEEIKFDREELFKLEELKLELQAQLDALRAEIDAALIPALDDQFFFLMTGNRDIDEPPSSLADHRSGEEIQKYRFLAEMQADANISTQLLASAFGLSDAATIEPLRERFEAVAGRIQRSISQLRQSDPVLADEFDRMFAQLFVLGGEDGGFDLRESELRLLSSQEDLLERSREVAANLLDNVNSLVAAAEVSVQDATGASEDAILTGRTLLLIISGFSVLGGLLIIYQVGRVLRRLARLSDWMRRMAGGNLELTADVGGRDEVADMAAALEVFRRHALEVQRLNLVEEMAEQLQEKNAQLEEVLTDLQRAQDQIVTREKLAALGELTAGVAHEIKNPLNFVKNFSEASEELIEELNEILEEIGDDISDEQKSWIAEIRGDLSSNLERIRSHGDRANRIVTDMLSMGRDTGEWQIVDINNLLEEHARLAYHSARAADSEFQLDLQHDLDPNVGEMRVIPRDLSRVFLNMVGNACDATDEKRREIWGATDENEPYGESYSPMLWLSTRSTDEHVEIRIKDNGNGIPPEVADKIFNPFFTTKPTDRGTGLGLAISSDIVRQHGGTINVDSKIGEYTEMLITLPTELPAEPSEGPGGAPSEQTGAAEAT